MYCQSCGAANSDDAKFCNQCGARIARAGESGGPAGGVPAAPAATAVGLGAPVAASAPQVSAPVAASAPPVGGPPSVGSAAPVNVWEQQQTSGAGGGPSMMSVSLDAIGVKSTKKVWAGITAVALLLIALGALGSWLLRGEPEVVTEAGHAQPEDPFVIGTPLPPGAGETPIAPVEEPTPTEESTMSAGTMRAGTTSMSDTTMSATSTRPSTSTGTMSTGTTSGTSSGSTTSTGTASMSGTTESGSTAGGTTTMSGTTESGSTAGGTTTMTESGTGASGGTDTGSTPNLGGDLPEERDLELELYGSRVRFVVRRYYAARAQGCFDRATRNNPNVSGTVVVNMTIGAEGNVSDTSIVRNTTGDEVLGNCLRSQVASWQLPPPPGGSLEMQMPFSR